MQVKTAILDIVRQINHILIQIEPCEYRQALPEFQGSTLGQHFRHILEFFQCLEQGRHTGLIDYASRERNLLYEDNPGIAAGALDAITENLSEFDLELLLKVRAEFGTDDRPAYASTLGRELLFVYDHAIHHLAMIKIGLFVHFPQVNIDKDLGVSPSTLKARKRQAH